MKFLESTDLVKIEDILPFFPDFVVIDDFKAEICTALEDYSARIEELKAEMDEATASAASIKRDIEGLANRFVTIEVGDKCWKCGVGLTSRQFYVFPCQHMFHADCLISMVSSSLGMTNIRRWSISPHRHYGEYCTSRTSWSPNRRILPAGHYYLPHSRNLARRPLDTAEKPRRRNKSHPDQQLPTYYSALQGGTNSWRLAIVYAS